MRRLLAMAITIVSVATLGAGAVVAARSFINDEAPSSQTSQASATPTLEEQVKAVQADQAKPPFIGDVLGIYVIGADQPVEAPDQYVTFEDICGPGAKGSVRVEWARAGELDLKFQLPSDYVLLPDDPDSGVLACIGGTEAVYAAKWMYQRKPGGQVVIGRVRITIADGMRVSSDRVKVVSISGRQGVLLEPIYPEGSPARSMGTESEVFFPESFGKTFIFSPDLPLSEVMKVAEVVAQATK